jgi:TPR repeat protein
MYRGSNGLTRNIQVAVEYFRLAADQHDAFALLMYGLALLKVNFGLFEIITA